MSFLLSLHLGLLIWLSIVLFTLFLSVILESPRTSTFIIVVSTVVLWYIFDIPIFRWMWNNPLWVLAGFAVYLPVGTGWSIVRWWLYVTRVKDEYVESREKWFRNNTHLSHDEAELAWHTHYTTENWNSKIPCHAGDNKELITLWILYWPFSMLWTLVDDPVRRLINWIYRQIQSVYTKITDRVFADVKIPSRKELQQLQAKIDKERNDIRKNHENL